MQLSELHSFALIGVLYWLGSLLLRKFPILTRGNLAASVVGGFCGGLLVWVLYKGCGISIGFDSEFRDLLLVIYFSTIGCTTDLQLLKKGGRPLMVLSVLAISLILVQNSVGVTLATSFGYPPAYGLLSGSIPFVGGFGSSAAWSKEFQTVGLTRALDVSIACSTLGLVLGGLFAGPFVAYLLRRHEISTSVSLQVPPATETHHEKYRLTAENALFSVAIIAASVLIGDCFKEVLTAINIVVPRFLTAMIVSVGLSNFVRIGVTSKLDESHEVIGDFVLHSFIILVLSGMQLWTLADLLVPLLIVATIQSLITILFCWRVIFPVMGRDYEAAVMAGATVAYGLSSFAVAMATIKTTIKHHGPAPRALLLMPLAGAAVVDLSNNLIISALFQLRWFVGH